MEIKPETQTLGLKTKSFKKTQWETLDKEKSSDSMRNAERKKIAVAKYAPNTIKLLQSD